MFKNNFNNALSNIIKFIYPPTCVICNNKSLNYNQVCDNCINNFNFTKGFLCSNCGTNLYISNYKIHLGNTCLNCVYNPPYFSALSSALVYNKYVAHLVSKFKYKDKQELTQILGDLLVYTYANSNWNNIDYIIPMPISYLKLLNRKYNQANLLAKYLSKYANIPVKSNALYKVKHTKAQASLKLKERLQNVKNSFAIKKRSSNLLENKNLLLIDDIVTTGSTINEASKVLRNAGAKKIYVLILARVKGDFKIY